jgi:hypothetical protein
MRNRPLLIRLLVLLPILAASLFTTVRTETTWVDPLSGTTKRETICFWGLSRTTVVKPSALEARHRRRRPDYLPTWKYVHATEYDVWGRPQLFACRHSPPLFDFNSVLDRLVEQATDDELVHLDDLLAQGDERQIEAALKTVFERTIPKIAADTKR